jgi:hypothetical protein
MGAPTGIRTLDMDLINDLFEMNSGYVLDFTDRTFAAFFAEALKINTTLDSRAASASRALSNAHLLT